MFEFDDTTELIFTWFFWVWVLRVMVSAKIFYGISLDILLRFTNLMSFHTSPISLSFSSGVLSLYSVGHPRCRRCTFSTQYLAQSRTLQYYSWCCEDNDAQHLLINANVRLSFTSLSVTRCSAITGLNSIVEWMHRSSGQIYRYHPENLPSTRPKIEYS